METASLYIESGCDTLKDNKSHDHNDTESGSMLR
jgi:hypothetical protein